MNTAENFLHTTHRTVNWFRKAFLDNSLSLSPPFQRNPVWTRLQQSYLVDTILNGLPIPELYMQDAISSDGTEKSILVDGQQRIRAVLEFVQGEYSLEGDDVSREWRNRKFNDLSEEEKKRFLSYKFVVRILPATLNDDSIRGVFSRMNKNVVPLNEQELRNATYSGPFIRIIQELSDSDPFWAECGVFSAKDHRRMIDQEYISELAIAYLHGPQNKKDNLDRYYLAYEETFDSGSDLSKVFRLVTSEIERTLPDIKKTRWRKKSDFYTLFLYLCNQSTDLPLSEGSTLGIRAKLARFGEQVDHVLKLEDEQRDGLDANVLAYAKAVSRAASDKQSRIARSDALRSFLHSDQPQLI